MTDVLIVSEEQAVALEKAGIKVEIQYIVKLADMLKLNQPATPAPKLKSPKSMRYPTETVLRWTGLKWTGNKDTQYHVAYLFLAAHFSKQQSKTLKRRDINALLTQEFSSRKQVFNAAVVTTLCNQKYLEPVA